MKKPRAWRYSRDTGYHYWEDDKLGHGHVFVTHEGTFGASAFGKFKVFKLLRDAKAFAEKNS